MGVHSIAYCFFFVLFCNLLLNIHLYILLTAAYQPAMEEMERTHLVKQMKEMRRVLIWMTTVMAGLCVHCMIMTKLKRMRLDLKQVTHSRHKPCILNSF